jgi:hypothetical protein
MLFSLVLSTVVECVKFRFCFVPFLVKMWLLKACFRLIFPVPVNLKRFLALPFVFIFGMALDFMVISFSSD